MSDQLTWASSAGAISGRSPGAAAGGSSSLGATVLGELAAAVEVAVAASKFPSCLAGVLVVEPVILVLVASRWASTFYIQRSYRVS